MKILGKKQIAELSFIDYVVGISIGSIAAEWSTAMDEPFYHYVIAISVYSMARDKNIFDVNDIAYALFETTGKLSILQKSVKSPLVAGIRKLQSSSVRPQNAQR